METTDDRDEEKQIGDDRDAPGRRDAGLDADENPDFAEEYDHPSGVLDAPRGHPRRS